MNTDKLQELSKKFLEELQNCEKKAKTESDFDELEGICESVLCGIPISILQKDYYKRSDVRTYLSDTEKEDTDKVSEAMKRLYDLDTISFCYDCVNQAIQDDLDEGAQNG